MGTSVYVTDREVTFDPDEIIVSKTDVKGRATYCDDNFLKIAGCREDEVLGQPHNIIRHPDNVVMDTQSTALGDAALVVSSSHVFRIGLKHTLLERNVYGSVVEANDHKTALVHLTGEHGIGILLVEFCGNDCNASGQLSDLVAAAGDLPIIVISDNPTLEGALAAIDSGASGYIDRNSGEEEFFEAIKSAEHGVIQLSRSIGSQKMTSATKVQSMPPASPSSGIPETLSPRQREILGEISKGKSNRDIAADLLISVNTVKAHVGAILGALGVKSRNQAAQLWHSESQEI